MLRRIFRPLAVFAAFAAIGAVIPLALDRGETQASVVCGNTSSATYTHWSGYKARSRLFTYVADGVSCYQPTTRYYQYDAYAYTPSGSNDYIAQIGFWSARAWSCGPLVYTNVYLTTNWWAVQLNTTPIN